MDVSVEIMRGALIAMLGTIRASSSAVSGVKSFETFMRSIKSRNFLSLGEPAITPSPSAQSHC
jgi:hypothetical protein